MEPINLSQTSSTEIPVNTIPDPGIGELAKDFKPLYERFGAQPTERTDRIFKEIWDYAKGVADDPNDRDSILWQISRLSAKLGSPSMGEKPWTKIMSYVSTLNQMKRAENRLKEMDHGGSI